jgi:hypothetical protein
MYPGQQFINLISDFIDELEAIQTEYWWWFKSRYGNHEKTGDDMISNHVILDYKDFDHLIFKFVECSDLPDSIRMKCIYAYIKVFNVII